MTSFLCWAFGIMCVVAPLQTQTFGASTFNVQQGGTGSTTLSGILIGNGTSPIQTLTIGTNLTLTGTTLDASGGAASSGLSTTSPIASSNVLVYSAAGAGSAYGVATGTISGTNGITVTAARSAIGGALAIDCTVASGGAAGCLASADWTTFNNKAAFAWTPDTTYGENANSTSTPIWLKDTLYASSTAFFTGLVTFANATGTQLQLTNNWLSQEGALGLDLTDDGSDLVLHANVGGINQFVIDTDGAFMEITANPGVANGYEMFAFEENQGANTTINFYEGGTGHNRIWNSGSMRLGGSAGYLCSNLTIGVDCDTSGTGADLVVEDDIWLGGKLLATSTADVSEFWGGILVNSASSTISNLDSINATSTNATSTNLYVSGQTRLGALSSALALAGSTGIMSNYAGASCTNQFVRSLNGAGAATCATVSLTADVSGDLPFANLAQVSANSILGNITGSTADAASIATSSLYAGTNGQILARVGGAWVGTATTTFSGGLTYSAGNVTNTITAGDGITRNTDDLDCDTASGTVFGCLASADWTTFNNKQDTITAGDALTLTGTDIDFDGGATPAGSLGGTWASPTIDDLFILNTGDVGTGSYTFPHASSTNISASNGLWMPSGASLSLVGAGAFGVDTTTGQFRWSDGVKTQIITATSSKSFNIASTTLDDQGKSFPVGTTTLIVQNNPEAITLAGFYCLATSTTASTRTALVRIGDGTNWTPAGSCSTTGTFFPTASNNTFTAFESFMVQVSSTASVIPLQRITITPVWSRTSD